MGKQKKKKSVLSLIIKLVLVVIGIYFGLIIRDYINIYGIGMPLYQCLLRFALLLVLLYIATYFHVIIHETGHLIFGLLTGYKFGSFRIKSFMLLKQDGKFKLKRYSLAGTSGQCLMFPPDLKDGKMPFILYNLGGSITNVVVSILFLFAFLLCVDYPMIALIPLTFAVAGFITAMINGIPMRLKMIANDGYNVVSLYNNAKAIRAMWIGLKIAENSLKGIRLKDMPAEWFTVPSDEEMKNSRLSSIGVFACNRLMDEEKFAEADALMEHLLGIESGISGLHRHLLICDRMYLELIGENRKEVVEGMLSKEQSKFMKAMKNFVSIKRTEYALALFYEEDVNKAQKTKEKFEEIAKFYPYSCDVESERRLIEVADLKK